jgi:amino acid adenylation domain-containing protein
VTPESAGGVASRKRHEQPRGVEAEAARWVDEWNRTEAAYPADRCIHQLIEEQAARTPDAAAVVFEDAWLTWRELDARANRLAHHLRRLGVRPEARVGVSLERSLEMVVGILGVLKAGGAYVPLDPGYPAERLSFMLDDCAVPVLLTHEAVRAKLPVSPGVAVVSLDAGWSAVAAESPEPLAVSLSPRNAAYVIYTSGSTGRPKGVVNEHGGVVNRLCWMQAEYEIGPGDAVLQKTPFSFDVSVWELFWPLQRGATLVMARPDGHRDPAYLAEAIGRHAITTLHFTPSMLGEFVDAADPARCGTLRRVICSGEALPSALARRFHARFAPPVSLHNLYGPTEAAVDVSYWPCPRVAGDVVPIGRPVWNTQLHVLDAAGNRVPLGETGELHIAGVQVARGYLNRAALTADRFVPDPFSATPGARMYRTGDHARWIEAPAGGANEVAATTAQAPSSRTAAEGSVRTPEIGATADGRANEFAATTAQSPPSRTVAEAPRLEASAGADRVLEYLGRIDHQVKVRGIRIELGEIEAHLRACHGVRDCAVLAVDDAAGEARLVAYVVGEVLVDELRPYLRRQLPEYMVPGPLVMLDRLPLTPNGKLDRRALPSPESAAAAAEYVAPRNAVEATLAGIWAEVLRRERIGVNDDFFSVGGHSLLGTRVVARIREVLDGEITVVSLFDHPTIAGLAPLLSERGDDARASVAAASPHRLLAELDDISDAELDRLLGAQP